MKLIDADRLILDLSVDPVKCCGCPEPEFLQDLVEILNNADEVKTTNKKPRYISFDLEKYKSKNEMFDAICTLLQILTDNRYVCSLRYEDCGIYVLEFDDEDMPEFELWHKFEEDDG